MRFLKSKPAFRKKGLLTSARGIGNGYGQRNLTHGGCDASLGKAIGISKLGLDCRTVAAAVKCRLVYGANRWMQRISLDANM